MNQCKVIILGATGSIGRSTLDVIRRNQDKFTVVGISAHTRTDELLSLAREFKLRDLAVSNEQAALKLKAQVGNDFQIHVKHESLLE
ncbi:1-deoxy-D-xylulose-5-phosphate reductoisomerase, partial [bacterium]|nr:1-deoxy-D-xylulose-5-phosphate reductoisomerase [bacterium]